ncbi:MAG TPA: aminotransferase class I/II-fold pyridoxal phosphate-dependent enzyme [Opitutaceae bacterium]|nr:aminotransferase class I/II-fold pyridoxal phosphate-dependent enzyme [Opitutaceae bacterium]
MLLGHGNDGYRLGRALRADFSTNVPPGGPPAHLREHLAAAFEGIGDYPDAAAESFVLAVAAAEGVPALNVGATNGAVAAIHQLAQVWSGRRSAIAVPAFSEYEDAARLRGHELVFFPAAELAAGALPAADIVWLANPNNPTGAVWPRDVLLALIDAHPRTTFVVDLAYAPLCEEPPLRAADAVVRRNLVLLLSFTKRFAIPGLRLGALVGPPELVADVVACGGPWAVNSLALAAGRFLLGRAAADEAPWRAALLQESRRLQAALAALPQLEVRRSATNYFLVRTRRGTGAELRRRLVDEHGLLVRDVANFRGLDADSVRIAAQTPRENGWLEEALAQWSTRG